MFVLAIAAGIAFPYEEFKSGTYQRVGLMKILKGNWINFILDFRLIKPKKFGFKTNVEAKDIKLKSFKGLN